MFGDYFLFEKIKNGEIVDPESTRSMLLTVGVLKENRICPIYKEDLNLHLDKSKSLLFRYWCVKCKKPHDVRNFTAFSAFRLKLSEIIQVIALFSLGTSVTKIKEKTGLANSSVQKIVNLCRLAILTFVEVNQPVLGKENAVEIDDTVIARRKYNKERLVQQQWLFGPIEREGGEILLRTVEKCDSVTLENIIRSFISEGVTVYSDKLAAYLSFF